MAISRYHYINPGDVGNNWQDIYEIELNAGKVASVVRLTKGAVSLPRYDSSSPVYSPDGTRIAYVEADAGGTNARLKVMDADDGNGDLMGDNMSVLDSADVDIATVAWGANDRLVYGKFDASKNTQIVSATLNGQSLGPITVHTADAEYPDSFTFVANDQLLYDADGRYLKHINLTSNHITQLSGPVPIDRTPTGIVGNNNIFFTRLVGSTLDLWQAVLDNNPSLSSETAVLSTPDFSETSVALSGDGGCLAYLASDLTVTYGPNSDLWIRDLATGQTKRITKTRDLAAVSWKP
ncbi:hypothetical protein J7426_03055 [Tropicibacter sp. R16_0]|uniref:hypothetical protein n=1 Tax=Tropicibacter sp. R16_0 TaxID=2821102 RepID=UPI001ADB295D|nr:hypothetical protein [Tropicibacter sp. R16_0]MBO9449220.1 hypothetical protein [Tropicibacter sp. R16_0]